MKLAILYHPKSDHGRIVEEYVRDFTRQRNKNIELLSLDTKEGAYRATLYDVVSYPAVLATRDDSQLLQLWQGLPLPTMNDLSAYSD